MTITIEPQLLERSKEKTLAIYGTSSLLSRIKDLPYNVRRPSFVGLVTEAGYTEFHPQVDIDVKEDFLKMFDNITRRWYDKYLAEMDDKKAEVLAAYHKLCQNIVDTVTNEQIVNGVIPTHVTEFVKEEGLKGFSSPKLSRMLAKLAPESSRFWSWYTNKCPKKLVKGENTAYKIVVSTLPHHVAGMSYYSSYNFDGKRWDGWQGTSCQDPLRNGDGGAMPQLAASVKDETLAVAFLCKTENSDLIDPVYEARALIRVVELSNGNVFYVVLRQFGYTESKAMLLNGLQNQYTNLFSNTTIRDTYSNSQGKCIRIHMDIESVVYRERSECPRCDNHEPDNCRRCNGSGYVDSATYSPYNDDSDIWSVNDEGTRITYRVPKKLLLDAGLYGTEVPEEAARKEEDEAA